MTSFQSSNKLTYYGLSVKFDHKEQKGEGQIQLV
jgi:hypothetical protein